MAEVRANDPRPKPLARARAAALRVYLVLGLGLGSLMLGSLLPSPAGGPLVLRALLANAWVLVMLPILCGLVGLVADVPRWRVATGAATVGEGLLVILGLLSEGGRFWSSLGGWTVVRAMALVLGVVLSVRAMAWAGSVTRRRQARAEALARERQAEYAAFSAEAERLAAKHEQKKE